MKRLVVWHKPHNRSYAWANSGWGRLYAKRHRCNARDVDLQFTSDLVAVGTHEGHGVHEFPGRPIVRHLPWRRVQRLRHRHGFRISRAITIMRRDHRLGITPCFEIKPGPHTHNPHAYAPLVAEARRLGTKLYLMSQPFGGDGIEALRIAKTVGGDDVYAILLPRGPIDHAWWNVIDDAKGQGVDRPADKPGRVVGRIA